MDKVFGNNNACDVNDVFVYTLTKPKAILFCMITPVDDNNICVIPLKAVEAIGVNIENINGKIKSLKEYYKSASKFEKYMFGKFNLLSVTYDEIDEPIVELKDVVRIEDLIFAQDTINHVEASKEQKEPLRVLKPEEFEKNIMYKNSNSDAGLVQSMLEEMEEVAAKRARKNHYPKAGWIDDFDPKPLSNDD